jgi:hypothetical protein
LKLWVFEELVSAHLNPTDSPFTKTNLNEKWKYRKEGTEVIFGRTIARYDFQSG